MRTETKVIQVANSPSEINAVNASQALWGWSVMSVQITDRKTVYDGDTTGYVDELGLHATTQRITETVNYATITYSRDLDAPNTAELRRLEKEYNDQTALATMYACTSPDESYLSYWPEEQAWYQEYHSKKKEKTKATKVSIMIGIVANFIFGQLFPFNYSSTGTLIISVIVQILAIMGTVLFIWGFIRKKYPKDPQAPARLAKILPLIEEGKERCKAEYNEAMALRASLVKQAQALQGM
jgi:hypothetical protein